MRTQPRPAPLHRPPAAARPSRHRAVTPCAAASQPPDAGPAPDLPPSTYAYVSSDGRRKAVVEDAAGLGGRGGAGDADVPWALSFQLSERTDALWNDGLKARLIQAGGGGAGRQDGGGAAGTALARSAHTPQSHAPLTFNPTRYLLF